MGSGQVKELPTVSQFNSISKEYDKLKSVGLTSEEIHTILCTRWKNNRRIESEIKESDDYDKEDGVRAVEMSEENIAVSKASPRVISHPQAKSSEAKNAPKDTIGLTLMIDDSLISSKVASKILVSSRFEVITANSAKMGYDILRNRKDDIDVIFLDVVMPEVDGVECLSWIKGNADVAHIPVYMLSGLEDQTLTDVCIERGAEGMILKPLDASKVQTIIEAHSIGRKYGFSIPSLVTTDVSTPTSSTSTNKASPKAPGPYQPSSEVKSEVVGPLSSNTLPVKVSQAVEARARPSASTSTTTTTTTMNTTSVRPISPKSVSISTKPNNPPMTSTISNILVGDQAPAFHLVTAQFKDFIFPPPSVAAPGPAMGSSFIYHHHQQLQQHKHDRKLFLLLFVPTIYQVELFEEDGFFMKFFSFYERIINTERVQVLCLSSDLPYALKAGQSRFSLPFELLSDPSNMITSKLVGSLNVGLMNCKEETKRTLEEREVLHAQNQFIGPNLAMMLLNSKRDVLQKWVAMPPLSLLSSSTSPKASTSITAAPSPSYFYQFPKQFEEMWLGVMEEDNGVEHFRHRSVLDPRASVLMTSRASVLNNSRFGEGPSIAQAAAAAVKNVMGTNQPITSTTTATNSNTNNSVRKHSQIQKGNGSKEVMNMPNSSNKSLRKASIKPPVIEEAPTKSARKASVMHSSGSAHPSPNSKPKRKRVKPVAGMILVVDDSSVSARIACKKLESLGYITEVVYNGEQAWDLLKKSSAENYLAILSDIIMPVCDGIAFLQLLADDPVLRDIPVIMQSGLESEELTANCLQLGACGVLKKPFQEAKFKAFLDEIYE